MKKLLTVVLCVGMMSGCSSVAVEYQKGRLQNYNDYTLCDFAGELTPSFSPRNEAAKQILKERGTYDKIQCIQTRNESFKYSIKRGAIEDQRRADEEERQRLISDIANEVRRARYY